MANPKWFDDNVYMNNKLVQLKAADADTYGDWDMYALEKAFSDAGFPGEEGAYAHFQQYGNTAAENISPNSNFIAKQYYIFKAADYYDVDVSAVTSAQAAYIADAIEKAGMSAWQHYVQYGTAEGINTSNNFDTNKYLQAKADALNAAKTDGKTNWTADDVAKAISDAGMNALSHAIQYADGSAGEAAAPFDASGNVIDAYKVDNKASSDDTGSTFTLTTGTDIVTGTSGDDTVIGDFSGPVTIQAADQINGGDGTDTFKVYGTYDADSMPVDLKNVEVLEIATADTTNDFTKYTKAKNGVAQIVVDDASAMNGAVTTGDEQTLSLASEAVTAGNVTWVGSTTDTASTLILNGFQTKASSTTPAKNLTITAAKVTTQTIESNGAANKVGVLDLGDATTSLVLTGDQKFTATTVYDGATSTTLKSIDASGTSGWR